MSRGARRAARALLVLLVAALPLAAAASASAAEPLSRSSRRWVRATLAGLDLEAKAAQLVMVPVAGEFRNPRSPAHRQLIAEVRELGVGGLVLFASELESVPRLLDELQRVARLPLLVAADLEQGVAFRVRRGTVSLPSAMAVGATRSPEAARFIGGVTAREGRALGIHWALAPVADVNSNPANPVINIRSYGEDPELVGRLAAAFVEGARAGGMLTTAKHFPGHGDTDIDSHFQRPTLAADRARLESVELVPFRRAIDAGVDAVMTAHLAVPAIDPTGAPATLSAPISTGLLRDALGFRGLIVTDALDMEGVRPAWAGEAAVRAVAAGADVVLMPPRPRVAVQSLVRAVREGQLSEERLAASVARVLESKARLGLHRQRLTAPQALGRDVARPEDVERARAVARDSITLVRNRGGILPLRAEEPLRLLHLLMSSRPGTLGRLEEAQAELERRRLEVESRVVGRELSTASLARLVAEAAEFSHVLVSALVEVSRAPDIDDLTASQAELLRRLAAAGPPLVVVSYGSPYFLAEVPELPVFLCAYGAAASSQQAAAAALFGETAIGGALPVGLPGLHSFGHGLELPRRPMGLAPAPPESAGFRPGALTEVDRILEGFRARGAFPGGVVAVGHRGSLVHLHPFGRLSWDEEAAPVRADTLYDLASLTKVVASTTMAMILADDGELDLDKPVQDFLPGFAGPGKEQVTVGHLLAHSSGLPAGGDLFRELSGRAAYFERIQALELEYEPGSRSLYSDFGMILLGEVLERVAGEPLDRFTRRRVFEPLGMAETLFRPAAELRPRIAPTEQDPWRGRLVRGEVHDENAYAMGGVAPHAGLFATAADLARYAQMILNGGVLEHRRIVSRATVERFTRRAGIPDSDRALGWDTKSAEGSSAGALFSPRSFGHLGFTGTSMWIDPDRRLFVILLTNRVHPSRDNLLIREARPAVADAVVRALAEP